MEKIIAIDGKNYRLVANGATPRVYRGLFHKDLFNGMSNAVNEKGEIRDSEVFENLAFCMAVQSGELSAQTKIDDWLGAMTSPLAIIEAAPDIMEMWTAETDTLSQEKKE